MKNNTTLRRNSLPFTSVLIGAVMLSGFYLYHEKNTRQYSSDIKTIAEKDKEPQGALGMMQYFFNARKNPITGKMDYAAMAKSAADANKLMYSNSTERVMSGLNMTWECMGPSNIGGRTRAILIDNQDPTRQTLFACAVSGGIWKSTNGGQLWDSVPGNDQLSSLNACDIAEDANGTLYVGTGEGFGIYALGDGFSTGMIGGGIFKSTDHGNSWAVIPSTSATSFTSLVGWDYVNRIAVDPHNPLNIYAATYGGLMYSGDGGNTWTVMKNSAGAHPSLGGNALDVKISTDGALLMAYTGGKLWYANVSGLVTQMTQVPSVLHHGGVYGGSCARIEIAISPSNPNYAYVSVIVSGAGGLGVFGQGAPAGTGIYFTMTAKNGTGGYWYEIGPGGSNTFNPYSSGGSQDQPCYDNALAVNSTNPGRLLLAGTVVWTWYQSSATDTVGTWTDLTYYGGQPHADNHALTFDPVNSNIVYDGSDGGVSKSFNGGSSWQPMNRNYNVTQFDAIAFAPNMSPIAAGYNVAEGVMGGTQDNGTPYINGLQYYYEDAVDVGGGDGGMSAISQISPNTYFATSDNSSLFRGGNLNTLGNPGNMYTNNLGACLGGNIDSVVNQSGGSGGCFYHQFTLWESNYDTTKNLNKLRWIADTVHDSGTIVYPVSPNGNLPFPYKLKAKVLTGDTLIITNPVVSKLATGFSAHNGVWLTMQAADLTDPVMWMPIGGPRSKPDAFDGTSSPIHTMAFSPDGDALFVGTEDGKLFRFSNLDSIVDTGYCTGALWYEVRGGGDVTNPNCRVISKSLGTYGYDILSISVDPTNGNNVIVTLGNYFSGTHIYYSNNALSATPTFTSAQGNLPQMPVYSSILNVLNSGQPNSALVGTERGIWSTTNINSPSPTWTFTNTGMANTLVQGLRQQTMPPWNCNNAYDVYVGTHGRGAWVSSTFYKAPTDVPAVADAVAKESLKVYPNPMSSRGTIEFYLPTESAHVAINVYDLTGRVIKTLALDNQSKGEHFATINVEGLSTGTYIATLAGEGFMKSTRFVVVK